MNKPLSEEALKKAIINYRIKCDIRLSDRDEGVITQAEYENSIEWELDRVIELIKADCQAWGEYIIGSDFSPNDFDERWVRLIPPNITHYETEDNAKIMNEAFAEIRQRNGSRS